MLAHQNNSEYRNTNPVRYLSFRDNNRQKHIIHSHYLKVTLAWPVLHGNPSYVAVCCCGVGKKRISSIYDSFYKVLIRNYKEN